MADELLTARPALGASPTPDDIFYVVDDVAGTPTGKKVTWAEMTAYGSGTAFPASPTDRQLFYRADRDLLYFYDLANTRWLSVQEHTIPFPLTTGAIDGTLSVTANAGRLSVPHRSTWSILVTRFQVVTDVLTTNDGSKYWTIKLNQATAPDVDTQIGTTMSTSGDTPGQWVDRFISPNVVVDAASRLLKLRVDKVSTPGTLYVTGNLSYRLVG